MYLDLFITIVLLWALFSGWRNGFLKELASMLGVISGLVLAALLYLWLGDDFLAVTGSEANMTLSIGAFLLLWIVLPIAAGFAATALTKALRHLHLGFGNSALGAVLCFVKHALLLSCVLTMMQRLHIIDTQRASESHLLAPTLSVLPFAKQQAAEVKDSAIDTVWVDLKAGSAKPRAEKQSSEK